MSLYSRLLAGAPDAGRRSNPLTGSVARRGVIETAVLAAAAIVMAVFLRSFVAQAFRIPSESMVPQLEVGDRVVVSRLAYHLHDPRRGDVVVFDCPPGEDCPRERPRSAARKALDTVLEALLLRQPRTEEFIKRVVALPGERVEGRGGAVWIDGRRLREPYLPARTRTSDFPPTLVPDDHVWVMGDNRGNSADSRVFGTVRADTIVGRALWRVWPPTRPAFL